MYIDGSSVFQTVPRERCNLIYCFNGKSEHLGSSDNISDVNSEFVHFYILGLEPPASTEFISYFSSFIPVKCQDNASVSQ
jgi:hypothetical protein